MKILLNNLKRVLKSYNTSHWSYLFLLLLIPCTSCWATEENYYTYFGIQQENFSEKDFEKKWKQKLKKEKNSINTTEFERKKWVLLHQKETYDQYLQDKDTTDFVEYLKKVTKEIKVEWEKFRETYIEKDKNEDNNGDSAYLYLFKKFPGYHALVIKVIFMMTDIDAINNIKKRANINAQASSDSQSTFFYCVLEEKKFRFALNMLLRLFGGEIDINAHPQGKKHPMALILEAFDDSNSDLFAKTADKEEYKKRKIRELLLNGLDEEGIKILQKHKFYKKHREAILNVLYYQKRRVFSWEEVGSISLFVAGISIALTLEACLRGKEKEENKWIDKWEDMEAWESVEYEEAE